jgi:hypothetical protein
VNKLVMSLNEKSLQNINLQAFNVLDIVTGRGGGK